MNSSFAIPICCAALACSTSAGTIAGRVRAEGKAAPGSDSGGANYDSRKFKFVERINYEALRGFVVCIEGPVGEKAAPPVEPLIVDTRRITQKGAEFAPHVLPVVVGTMVEWPNNDDIYHNVFSMSEAKPFDLGLYKGNPDAKRVTFDKSGRVDVFCSIHANMHCIVLVLENPYFDVADDKGLYVITNVPPGTYRLKAWHERMPPETREVTVPNTGEVRADFVLGIAHLPKY